MKRVITLFLLFLLCTDFYAEENEKEDSLSLDLTANIHAPRVGQRVTIELKIVGQAIADIIKDTNDIEPIQQEKPEFVYQFFFQPQKEGDYTLGPYSLSFNGVDLESNSLLIKVLPEWDGRFGTFFRVDCNEIYLGQSFELVMETWSKERLEFNISVISNPELASIESRFTWYQTTFKNGEETHYNMHLWTITPKSRGEFLVTKDLFRNFPEDIEPPQLKVQVK